MPRALTARERRERRAAQIQRAKRILNGYLNTHKNQIQQKLPIAQLKQVNDGLSRFIQNYRNNNELTNSMLRPFDTKLQKLRAKIAQQNADLEGKLIRRATRRRQAAVPQAANLQARYQTALDELNRYQNYMPNRTYQNYYADLRYAQSTIPHELSQVDVPSGAVSREIIDRIWDLNESHTQVFQRCRIRNTRRVGQFNIRFDFRWANNNRLIRHANGRTIQNVSLREGLYNVLSRAISNIFEGYHHDNSNFVLVDIRNVRIDPVVRAEIRQHRVRQSSLKDRRFPDDQFANEGQCAFDWIVLSSINMKHFTTITRKELVEAWGEDALIYGPTIQQIIDWAKKRGDIYLNLIDCFGNSIEIVKSRCEHRNALRLYGMIKDNHVFAITDPKMQTRLAKTNHIDLSYAPEVCLDVNNEYVELEDSRLLNGEFDSNLILINTDDLNQLMMDCVRKFGECDVQPMVHKDHVIQFTHPNTKKVYQAVTDYYPRKQACEQIGIPFRNQTFAKIGHELFKLQQGFLPQSIYNPELHDWFTNCPIGGIIQKFKLNDSSLKRVILDCKNCYPACVADLPEILPILTGLEFPESFNGTLNPLGDYYIARDLHLGNGIVKPGPGRYPFLFIRFMLNKKFIALSDITHQVVAQSYIHSQALKEFVEYCLNTSSQAKMMLNQFIGSLAKMANVSEKAAITTSKEYVSCMYQQYGGSNLHHNDFEDLFLMKLKSIHPVLFGNIMINNMILTLAWIKVLNMVDYIKTNLPECTINEIKTDGISIEFPSKYYKVLKQQFKSKSECKPGEWGLEPPKGSQLTMDPERRNTRKPWRNNELKLPKQQIPITYNELKNTQNGCLILGGPGTGKTFGIKEWIQPNDILTATTNAVADKHRADGLKSQTLDSFLMANIDMRVSPQTRLKEKIAILERARKRGSRLIVDEDGMNSRENKIAIMASGIKPINIMDPLQLHAVDPTKKQWRDWSTETATKYSTNGYIINLDYQEGTSRYDKPLRDVLQYLVKYEKLHPCLNDPKYRLKPMLTTNISYTNPKRKEINQILFDQIVWKEDKQVFRIGKMRLYIGVPLLAFENNKKFNYFNSQFFTVVEIRDTTIVLEGEGKTIEIEFEHLKDFDYAFCATTHKSQGRTINEEYNIYEVSKMDFRLLYVALSRARSLDQIHIDEFTDRQFELDHPELGPICIEMKKPSLVNCIIYAIYKKNSEIIQYIGRTIKTLEQRMNRHLTDENEPEQMKEFFQNNEYEFKSICSQKFIKDDFEGRKKLEDYYIKKYNPPLNQQNLPKPDKRIHDITQQSMPKANHDEEYKIRDYDTYFHIKGPGVQKKFRYKSKPKDAVYKEAKEFRKKILIELYGTDY